MKAITTRFSKYFWLSQLITLFFWCTYFAASGQSPLLLDSLKNELVTADGPMKADLYLNISEQFIKQGLIDSAVTYATLGRDHSAGIGYKKGQAISLDVLAMVAFNSRDLEKAMELTRSAIDIWETTDDKRGLATSLHNLGRNYYYSNNYEKALEYYFKSIEIDEAEEDISGLAPSYMNVAIVQNRIGRDTLAMEYFTKAIELAKRLKDDYTIMVGCVNLAGLYLKLDDLDNALVYAKRGLEISIKLNVAPGIVKSASSLSHIYFEKGAYEDALENAEIVLASDYRDFESRSRAFRVKAKVLETEGKNREAIRFAEKGLVEAKSGGEIPAILGNEEQLYQLHKKQGDYKKALAHKEAYHSLSDSLFNVEKNEQINLLTEKFEAAKKQKEIDDLLQDAEVASLRLRQKNGLILFLAFFTLAIFAAVYYFNQQKLSEEKRKTLLMQQKLLRSQMNPHFIFNALTAIQNFFLEKSDGPKAAFYLSKFAKLMRLILENSREDYIQLDQEIATLENYLNLQKVRFNDSFDFSIECDPGLDQEITAVPPMLAQPFIENSLEHGLLHKEEAGKVKIKFEKIEDILEFTIEDNGVGREKAARIKADYQKQHESMATRITKDRLTVLNRKLKRKAKLFINDVLDTNREIAGTKVTIQIPLVMS
ncbi:MAG: tetratricopeptide repeat protein [Bacteroidota bacterium]